MNLVRIGGVLTVAFLAGFIYLMRREEIRRERKLHPPIEGHA